MDFRTILDMTHKTAIEELGEYLIVSKSRMDNFLTCLESGAKKIKQLEEENLELREQISNLVKSQRR